MTQELKDERAAFETYCSSIAIEDCLERNAVGGYLDEYIDSLWEGWQAARRTAPDREAVIEECAYQCDLVANIAERNNLIPQMDCAANLAKSIRALKATPTASQLAALDRLAQNARELGLDYEPMGAPTDAEGEKS
jgi:hypothetical protein